WDHGGEAVEDAQQCVSSHLTIVLQWGHGNLAVEDSSPGRLSKAEASTSRGPRRFHRGRPSRLGPLGDGRFKLQWGHGGFAVEDYDGWNLSINCWRLQLGHGDSAVEDLSSSGHSLLIPAELQWGHGDVAVEDALPGQSLTVEASTSMGPRQFHRGGL